MDVSSINYIDLGVALLLLVGLLGGIKRGLSGELARVLGIALSLYAAWRFAEPVAGYLQQHLNQALDRSYALAFLFIALGGLLAMYLLRVMLKNVLHFAFKGRMERAGGAVCGLLRAAAIASIILIALHMAPRGGVLRDHLDTSRAGALASRYLLPLYASLQEKAPALNLPPADPAAETHGAAVY